MKHILNPHFLGNMPLAAGADADQQVATRVKAAFASVNHPVVPLHWVLDKLSFVSESLEDGDFLCHSRISVVGCRLLQLLNHITLRDVVK